MRRGLLEPLRRTPPSVPLRALLVGEVLGYVGALAAFIWVTGPGHGHLEIGLAHVAFIVFAVLFPMAMKLLHGDCPADSGLRRDTLRAATRLTLPVTAAMALFVIVVGLACGGVHWLGWARLAEMSGAYLAWGFAQQYLLQAFALRRLEQAGLRGYAAAVAASGVFALLHLPSPALVAVTFGAGIAWCRIFQRRCNLFPLALAHAVLAVLLYHAWPEAWLHRMTIGPAFLHRAGW